MFRHKNVGQEGFSVVEIESVGSTVAGFKKELAVDEIVAIGVQDDTGVITVIDKTNNNSAVVNVHIEGGTQTLAVSHGHSSIGTAIGTASKINVYYDATNGLSVENKLAASTEVVVKFGM